MSKLRISTPARGDSTPKEITCPLFIPTLIFTKIVLAKKIAQGKPPKPTPSPTYLPTYQSIVIPYLHNYLRNETSNHTSIYIHHVLYLSYVAVEHNILRVVKSARASVYIVLK
jgi:hypothetical protein